MGGTLHITYRPRADTTPEGELSALASVYAYVLKSHDSKRPTSPPLSLLAVTTESRSKETPPMATSYPTEPNSRDMLPMLRELFSKHPEYRHHEAWELQHVLWSLGYSDELLDEASIAAAAEVARTDHDPDEAA